MVLGFAELYITIIIGTDQRTCGIQDPSQCGLEVPRRRISLWVQIALDVIDRTLQDEDLVSQSVEFGALDDELILAELEFLGPLSGHPVPLSAGLTAELSRTTARGSWRHGLATPRTLAHLLTTGLFRHDEKVGHGCVVVVDRSPYWSVQLRSVPPDRWFASDNAAGAAPQVLAALLDANTGHALAYGNDPWTIRAQESFRALFDRDVVTQFAYGGTGANVFALGCLLRPAEAVVCSRVAHVTYDETGAAERIIGTKLLEVETVDGKVTPAGLSSVRHLLGSEHHVQPAVLTITQATEMGTLYSIEEIRTLCSLAHEMGLLVHMDGARIANAVAALGGTSAVLRAMTFDAGVDVVTFGGTKCGGVFGEAVIFARPELATRSKYIRKQTTQLHSKMRFISAQYEALLADGLFIDLGRRANEAARLLHESVRDIATLGLGAPPQVNSVFPRLQDPAKSALQDWSFFWDWDVAASQVRWMTAWDTSPTDVDRFVSGIREALL